MAKAARKSKAKNKAASRSNTKAATPNKTKIGAAADRPIYLTEADVQRLVSVKDAIATLELLFETWPNPATVNLPRQRARIGKGNFNLMGAAWGTGESFGRSE